MPRQPRTLHPERNTRISAYQARIERRLVDVLIDVPTYAQALQPLAARRGGEDWRLIAVAHTHGRAICELCGHNPIRRLFFIKNEASGQELMVGSECAVNYANADLVRGYLSRLTSQQNRNRRQERLEEVCRNRQVQAERLRNERVAAWMALPDREAITNFLAAGISDTSRSAYLVRSFERWLSSNGFLTDSQTMTARNIMAEFANAPAPTVAEIRNAEAADLPNIADARYHVERNGVDRQFQIHTVQRGALAGKRIIKVKRDGVYKGFAFLTTAPGVRTWRSAQEWVSENDRQLARAMVKAAQSFANIPLSVMTSLDGMSYMVTRSEVVARPAPEAAVTPVSGRRTARTYTRRTPLAMSEINSQEVR